MKYSFTNKYWQPQLKIDEGNSELFSNQFYCGRLYFVDSWNICCFLDVLDKKASSARRVMTEKQEFTFRK